MRWTFSNRAYALVSAMVLSVVMTAGWSQSITWLGTLGGVDSEAWGVSNNAQVVGRARFSNGRLRAFRWANGVMYDLGTIGISSEATGISVDGSVVVGWGSPSTSNPGPFAYRWVAGGAHSLGTLGGNASAAWGVSADGSVIVGWARSSPNNQERAFRWTQSGGMRNLGTLGGNASAAWGTSADGAVVVGWAFNASGQRRAFRWTQATGMVDLSTLGGNTSDARGVSADGSVVVGWAENASGQRHAFRWENGVMQDLGTFSGNESIAQDVSGDSSIIVGSATNASNQNRAFRWTQGSGLEDLNLTYASLLTGGSVLYDARGISPDGRYIVGVGFHAASGRNEAFLLDTVPEPASLIALSAGLVGLLGWRRHRA